MNTTLIATVIEEGAKLAGDVIRHAVMHTRSRAHEVPSSHDSGEVAKAITEPEVRSPEPEVPSPQPETPHFESGTSLEHADNDLPYRFECVVKHLGGASVLLREGFERANDEGIGQGTAEKVIEAMNEHSAMEADLEKMLPIKEVQDVTKRILSGARQFRASAWKAGLPKGEGSIDDIEAARMWNNILLNEVITAAQKFPGTHCVREGM